MRLADMTEGDRAWVGLLIYVAAYDTCAIIQGRETLSSSFARALQHPVRRWPTMVAWAYLTGHLFEILPREIDPLRRWTRTH